MLDAMPDTSLLVQSLGRCLLISAGGILAVGAMYATTGSFLSLYRRRSSPLINARSKSSPSEHALLDEAWRRAVALAVTALGVVAGAPWINALFQDVLSDWDLSGNGDPPWIYGVLALIVWAGLLPFALFVWNLPRRAAGRFQHATIESRLPQLSGRSIGAVDGSRADGLDEQPPHSDPVRRACRRYAIAVALCAPAIADDHAARGRWCPPLEAMLLLPAVVAVLLVATVNVWVVVACIAIIVAWCSAMCVTNYRSAVTAPGTLVADYLLITSLAVTQRIDQAMRLALACLDPNPAALQDHEQFTAVLSRAVRIDSVPWDPRSVKASHVDVTTRLWMLDRVGRDQEIAVVFQLRRQQDQVWRITRITVEELYGHLALARAPRFAVAAAWMPA